VTPPVPTLHAITDDRVLRSPWFFDVARALSIGAAVAVHLRGRISAREMIAVADRLRPLLGEAKLFINDRVDIARLVHADGVHLPAGGLPTAAARRLLPETTLIGRSAHSVEETRDALRDGADYCFLGPIFATASHADRAAVGIAGIRAVGRGPVVGIGGITPELASACRAAGATGVAAITALWDAADPGAAAERFLLSFV